MEKVDVGCIEYISKRDILRGSKLSAGIDLYVDSLNQPISWDELHYAVRIGTGLRLNMTTLNLPIVALVALRSGASYEYPIALTNAVAMIDQDYQGELILQVKYPKPAMVDEVTSVGSAFKSSDLFGKRIAQITFMPCYTFGLGEDVGSYLPAQVARTGIRFQKVEQFSTVSARGTSGLGSTGST